MADYIEHGIDRRILKQLVAAHRIKRVVLLGIATKNKILYSAQVELKTSPLKHHVTGKNGEKRVWALAGHALDFLFKLGISEIDVIFVNGAHNE